MRPTLIAEVMGNPRGLKPVFAAIGGAVIPDKELRIHGRLELRVLGHQKLQPGQRVLIRDQDIDGWVHVNYGILGITIRGGLLICVQMGGGLGDIFNWLFMHEMYATLGKLPPEEKALIILTCGNPYAQELFRWHPKASQFEVHNLGFMMPAEYEPIKKKNGWPENTPSAYFPQQNVQFYPGPSDAQPLAELKPLKYIVINPAAGHPGRNIPSPYYKDAIDVILTYGRQRYGLNAVVVGRTYDSNKDPAHNHVEPKIKARDGLIDLIDKVSVPATLQIIRDSVGVLCCHSAVCLASWYMKKPSFLMYKKDWGDTQINIDLKSPYNFGRDFPTTRHTHFEAYKRSFMEEFLDMAVKNHLETRA